MAQQEGALVANLELPNGEHVLAWGSVTEPGAWIALQGTASGIVRGAAGSPIGVIVVDRAAEPAIITDRSLGRAVVTCRSVCRANAPIGGADGLAHEGALRAP